MTTFSVSDQALAVPDERLLHAAVAAYLGRYRGESRVHASSDLKVFLTWCAGQDLNPLNLGRAEVERYVRWLQEVRRYQPSTVSRRLSVVVGFYRVCVIDQILVHSPADYVRRPPMSADSTLGVGHLQFENDWDFDSARDDTPEEMRTLFDEAVSRSDAVIDEALARGGLDEESVLTSPQTGETFTLRWILVHMIEEYARHNGHADLIRESIDGQTG